MLAQPTSREASPYRDDRARPFTLAPNAILGGNIWTRTPAAVQFSRRGVAPFFVLIALWGLIHYSLRLPFAEFFLVLLVVPLSALACIRVNERLDRDRASILPVASLLAAFCRCGGCAYRLDEIMPEPDGCRVCPECGAAWHKDRHTFVSPPSGGESQSPAHPTPPSSASNPRRDIVTDPLLVELLASLRTANRVKLDDDRGVPMDQPWTWPPKWFGLRSADVDLEAKLRHIASDTAAKMRRRLLWPFSLIAVLGAAVATTVVTLRSNEFDLAQVVVVYLIFLILAVTAFRALVHLFVERATRREAVRQLRMCCNCGHALPNDPPKTFDNCTPCTHCGRAWKQAETL